MQEHLMQRKQIHPEIQFIIHSRDGVQIIMLQLLEIKMQVLFIRLDIKTDYLIMHMKQWQMKWIH